MEHFHHPGSPFSQTLVALLQSTWRTAAAASAGTLLEMRILGPYPDPQDQKLWAEPRNLCFRGDADECWSWKTIVLGHLGFLNNRQLGRSQMQDSSTWGSTLGWKETPSWQEPIKWCPSLCGARRTDVKANSWSLEDRLFLQHDSGRPQCHCRCIGAHYPITWGLW